MEIANGCLEIFSTFVIFILLISMHTKQSTNIFEKRLTVMVILHMVVLLLDAARWFLSQQLDFPILLVILSVMPTILALIGNGIFIYFAVTFLSSRGPISQKTKLTLLLLLFSALLVWAAFILSNGIQSASNIQTNHEDMRFNWAYWVGHLGWATVCLLGIVFILRCRRGLKRIELLSLLSYCIFPLFALFLRFFWDGSQIFLSTSLSLIWIYAVIQREQRLLLQEQENQLTQSRIAILLSQIQPHFLYNTLTTICGLCDENPKEAKIATAAFADYLRHNLESLSQSTLIPFEEELQHTQLYLTIERKRFEEKINICYNIETVDFCIPSLTIQPLVENAVKHGILKRKNGGTLTISTRCSSKNYEIEIHDNGVGFDLIAPLEKSHVHIGIENVRDRLWSMCSGTLTIESIINHGTTAIIHIPRRDT